MNRDKIASDITHQLMTDNFGAKAVRLVLEAPTDAYADNYGGRNELSVVTTIREGLSHVVPLPYAYDDLTDESKKRLTDYISRLPCK